jgi:hypothetical protein
MVSTILQSLLFLLDPTPACDFQWVAALLQWLIGQFQCRFSNSLIDIRRDMDATTTAVFLVTSFNVYTTLCSDARECPPSATVVVTSTTVMASTTTICSTPGAVFPSLGASSMPVSSPALPTAPGSSTATPALPVGPGDTAASSVATSVASQPSGQTFSFSIIPGSSVESTVSVVPPTPSASGYLPPGTSSSAIPTVPTPGGPSIIETTVVVSGTTLVATLTPIYGVPAPSGHLPSSPVSGPVVPSNTNTDATHTSFPATPSSGGYNVPSGSSGVPSNTAPDAVPTSYPVSSTGSSFAEPSTPAGEISSVGGISSSMSASRSSFTGQSSGYPVGPSTSGPFASATSSYAEPSASDSTLPSAPGSASPSASGTSASASSSSVSAYPPAFGSSSPAGPYSSPAFPSASGPSAPVVPSASGSSPSAGPYSSSTPDTISTTKQGPPGTAPGYTSSAAAGSTTASRPTLRSTTSMSGGYGPPTPPVESESPANSTVRVTSYPTQTLTSLITSPLPYSVPNSTYTASDIEATDISRGTSASAFPSGSG